MCEQTLEWCPATPFRPRRCVHHKAVIPSRASATDAQRESSRSGTRGPVRDPMMSDEAILRTGRPGRTSSATKKCRIRHRFRPQDNRADHHAGTFRASGATASPSETRTDIGRTIAASEVADTMGCAPHSSPIPLCNIKFDSCLLSTPPALDVPSSRGAVVPPSGPPDDPSTPR